MPITASVWWRKTMTWMKQEKPKLRTRSFVLAAVAIAGGGLGAACSKDDADSGETHFLACHTDADCKPAGSEYRCAADNRCRVPGTNKDGGTRDSGGNA